MTVAIALNPAHILESIAERIVTPRPDCRLWAAAMDRGYGRVSVDGKVVRVHRLVWELTVGPIPDGMTIDHLCRVRNCLNVEHMELVTQGENTKRALPYRPATRKTHCLRGHEFTPENTRARASGWRTCLECERIRYLERRARQTAQLDGGAR